MDKIIIGGKYKHFKGGIYKVIAVGRHTERAETDIVYSDSDGAVWIRPLSQFIGKVEHETLDRFTLIK